MSMKGGCLCGAVRYEISGEPILTVNCYCRDCQIETWSGHSAIMCVPRNTVTFKGSLQSFDRSADSGRNISRFFCPICGTTLWGQAEMMPDATNIRVGTLDESDAVEMQISAYCASARGWDRPLDGPAQFPAMPVLD